MKIAVVGVTGLVGNVILQVLTERHFETCTLLAVASERSIGKSIEFNGKEYKVISVTEAIEACPDIAIFSAGSGVSLQYASLFAEKGTYVIDNSSAWRMYDHIPLIVPEINAGILKANDRIIANPNCSTFKWYGFILNTTVHHTANCCLHLPIGNGNWNESFESIKL